MGAICTFRQPGKSFTMPHYDWQQAVREFGIKPGDRVLDVGGGDMPFERADVVTDAFLSESHHRGGRPIRQDKHYVECRVEAMPFADKAFDFVYCNHVLEHTDDPMAACRELMRVGKRGYIEVPSYWAEYVFSDTVHYWLIDWVDGTLVFRRKPYHQEKREDTPFKGIVHKYWAENRQDFLLDWQVWHRNLWTIQILWDEAGFGCRVEDSPELTIAPSPEGMAPQHTEVSTPGGTLALPRQNAFGKVYPTPFEEQLVETLGIVPGDRVLAIGDGLPTRADHVATSFEDLPDDQTFDFAYCADALESLDDPAAACEALMRVAKRGFLEVTHTWAALMMGAPAHQWLLEMNEGVLTFRRRRYEAPPFKNVLRGEYVRDPDFRYRYDIAYRNVSRIQLAWEGRFAYRIIDEGHEFDYRNPLQAARSHYHSARCDLQQGVAVELVATELRKALELDPQLQEARRELDAISKVGTGISAIVHTLNEESRVEEALKSLQGWVDEIIVVDMHSDDRTVEIARRYTDRVYLHERVRDFDRVRNFSADLARYPWVFYLDADERVPEALGKDIRAFVTRGGDGCAAMQLPYKNYFAGKWIRHAGQWWPGYKAPMLLKKGAFHWGGRMHLGAEIDGAIGRFPCDNPDLAITHYSYESVGHLIQKQNVYTDAEAAYLHDDGKTFHWKSAVAGFVQDFQLYYDHFGGAADGPHGFLLSFFAGFYRFAAQAKLFDRHHREGTLAHSEHEVPADLAEVLQYALAVAQGQASAPSPIPRRSTFAEAAQDLMAYLGISEGELNRRIQDCSDTLREDWLARDPNTEAELRQYYGSVEGYLYGLTKFNYDPSYIAWRDAMVQVCQAAVAERGCLEVLDYGAGIGTNLVDLTRIPGIRGTHADVPGKNFDYAAWRYQRHGSPVDMLTITDADPLGDRRFDVILCIDVLEHLPDPEQAIRYLSEHLRPGGYLIATVWFTLENPEDEGIIHLNTDKYTNASFWALVDHMGLIPCGQDDTQNQFRVYRKPMVSSLLWQAPLFDPSGYADEARNFLLGLGDIGTSVKAFPLNWSTRIAPLAPEVSERIGVMQGTELGDAFVNVMHIFPTFFQRHPQAAYNIGRTMFETDRIPADWITKCNEMDEIWVPTDFNIETFTAAGVSPEKLVKVPGSIDATRFRSEAEPLEIAERRGYNFLSVFDWSLRKGWDVLLKAYLTEFKADEDVALILKVYSTSGLSIEDIQAQVLDYVQNTLGLDPTAIPDVVFLETTIPDEGMPRLYKAVDAYVMPSRGEGWGRPLMEAMAMGLPTIGTGWSGNTEFMNARNSWLVDYQLVEVPEAALREVPNFRGHRWAEPSADHLRALMRHVFTHREEARAKGAHARQEILTHFDRQAVARLIANRLEAIPSDRKLRVAWEGNQFVFHSLAHVNREFALGLMETDEVDLTLIANEVPELDETADPRFPALTRYLGKPLPAPVDVHVRHAYPPQFEPPSEGHWVMIQPWEFGGIPQAWFPSMRDAVDEIWAYTQFVRDCYLQSGIPADKVHVVPLGVDTQTFTPEGPRTELPTRKRFKFLFVGGTIYRKGIDILLDTYLKTFKASDDVCLVIKDFCVKTSYRENTFPERIRQAQANPDNPEILYLSDDLSSDGLAALYRACDALVHPYRGEGFGLPIAEAMACGLPAILPNAGACLDYCDEESALLVPARTVRLEETSDLPPTQVGYWVSEVPPGALAKAMLNLWQNPERGKDIGRRASERIHREFTWEQATQKAMERLRALREKPILRFAPDFVDPRTFHPAVDPLEIEGKRTLNLLAIPDWNAPRWIPLLTAYLEAFKPEDDVALVLRIDPKGPLSTGQAQEKVLEVIAMAGHDPEKIPDILLVDTPLTPEREGGLYTACQALLSEGRAEIDRRAKACGLPLVGVEAPPALRQLLPGRALA